MKYLFSGFTSTIFLLQFFLFGEEVKTVASTVESATVYEDRALVTRSANLNLTSGKHQIILAGLPDGLIDYSVRVSGDGAAAVKILDVKIEEEYFAEISEQAMRQYHQHRDSLKFEKQAVLDRISVLETQKGFIESLKSESSQDINRDLVRQAPAVENWQKMVQFFGDNLGNIYDELRNQRKQQQQIKNKIEIINHKIKQGSSSHSSKKIRVPLLVESPGSLKLSVSYLIHGASWKPVYDARILAEKKMLELTYFAIVEQNTGENWDNTKLTLSTAKPHSTPEIPLLIPLYITTNSRVNNYLSSSGKAGNAFYDRLPANMFYKPNRRIPPGHGYIEGKILDRSSKEPLPYVNVTIGESTFGAATDSDGYFKIPRVPAGWHSVYVNFIGYGDIQAKIEVKEGYTLNLDFYLEESSVEGQAAYVAAPHPEQTVRYSLANIERKLTAAIFEIPEQNDIPSDGAPHKVMIMNKALNVDFDYIAIPRELEKIFLKSQVKNATDVTLLGGRVNIFLENEFINQTTISNIAPNETFDLALGVDESINVKRTMINRYFETKGLFGGKQKVTYEFEITVTNHKRTEESIQVIDQLPISRDEKVNVKLLSPDEKDVKIDRLKNITWAVNLKPGESQKLPLKFQVEFPNYASIVEVK